MPAVLIPNPDKLHPMGIRMPIGLRDKLQLLAYRERRSLGGQICFMLTQSIKIEEEANGPLIKPDEQPKESPKAR